MGILMRNIYKICVDEEMEATIYFYTAEDDSYGSVTVNPRSKQLGKDYRGIYKIGRLGDNGKFQYTEMEEIFVFDNFVDGMVYSVLYRCGEEILLEEILAYM